MSQEFTGTWRSMCRTLKAGEWPPWIDNICLVFTSGCLFLTVIAGQTGREKVVVFWGSLGFYHRQRWFLLHCQHNLLLKPPKTTVLSLIKQVLKHGIWVVPIGVREGNGGLAWCHYLYVREEGNNCYTAVACNDYYSRKESHKGVKPCYSFTLFQICWNKSKQHKSPLWFLIFSSWVFICDCLNWNVWCQKASRSQSLFTHKEHFRL